MAASGLKMKLKTVLSMVFFLVICLVVVAGLFLLLRAAALAVLRLQSPVASVIVAGLLTLLTSLLVNAWNRYAENKREERSRLREAKRPAYERLLGVFFGSMRTSVAQGSAAATPMSLDQETVDEMVRMVQDLLVWGSDDMIRLWGQFRQNATIDGGTGSPERALQILADLMLAVRRELGHTKTNVSRVELLRLIINDLDDALASSTLKL